MDDKTTWPPQPYRKDHSRRYQDILEAEMDLRATMGQPVSRRILARQLCSEAGCGEAEARAFVREYCDRHGLLRWTVWHSAQVAIVSVFLCVTSVLVGWVHGLALPSGHNRGQAGRTITHEMGVAVSVVVLSVLVAVSLSVIVSLLERAAGQQAPQDEC